MRGVASDKESACGWGTSASLRLPYRHGYLQISFVDLETRTRCVREPLHLRHPTRALDSLHVGAKPPPPHTRLDDGFALGLGDLRVLANVVFYKLLPSLEIRLPRWAQLLRPIDFLRDIRNLVGFAADETEQRRGERAADLASWSRLQT
jgi:hypothetical protein